MNQFDIQSTTESSFPRYGSIYDVNLDPVIGSEIDKQRPAIVVSNDLNNQYSQIVTVVPLTGQQEDRAYPFEIVIPQRVGGLTTKSRAKGNQIRTIDKRRVVQLRGTLPAEYMGELGEAIIIHLNLK